jgi:hypothetical protein
MNCPHCNSPSADGKNYCADCGAPFDPQTKYLETFVKAQIEEVIHRKFKDQNAVRNETSQAVFDHVEHRVKQFLFFAGIPAALLLFLLTVAGIEKYRDFTGMVETAQSQVKQRIEQVKGEIEQAQTKATNAKANADEALKTTDTVTAEVNKELGAAKEITRNVQALSVRVSELEKKSSSQMRASTERIEAQVKDLHQQMDATSKGMLEQEKKLASTDELVKALFSKGITEYFQTSANSPAAVIVSLQVAGKNSAFVFMLLKSAPIFQTVELKWRVASQPRNSFGLIKNNILFFNWGEPIENLRQNPIEVYYVPDPTSKTPAFKALSIREGTIFADDEAVFSVPPSTH